MGVGGRDTLLGSTKFLIRFRTVCKQLKALLEDKRFAKNHLARVARPQFILFSKSITYSIDVILNDCPSIEVRKLPLDITGHGYVSKLFFDGYCDGLLLCATSKDIAVCNPWLTQARWIKRKEGSYDSDACGIGYDTRRSDSHLKVFESYHNDYYTLMKTYITDFGSNASISNEIATESWCLSRDSVSLNGTLYWIASSIDFSEFYIKSFNFSVEEFQYLCALPGKRGLFYYHRSLEVFKRDRFSYLHQCDETSNIEIWVTKRKIENEDGETVEWMRFMNVSVPSSSDLKVIDLNCRRSYIIDEKTLTLVLCCSGIAGRSCIYILKGDKHKKIKIEPENDFTEYPCHLHHRTYFPSLVQVPSYLGEGEEIQI